jgi:putative phosphonate metabolism protein
LIGLLRPGLTLALGPRSSVIILQENGRTVAAYRPRGTVTALQQAHAFPEIYSAMRRYALYYAPRPQERLAAFARGWLGYDPDLGSSFTFTDMDGIEPQLRLSAVADPRRYGFHATLKAPFQLAPDVKERDLLDSASVFANACPSLETALRMHEIGRFLALVPTRNAAALSGLASCCVREFDRFRAPLDEATLARRRAAGLTERQEKYLAEWGYPYVLEEFRFHMTLTGPLSREERKRIHAALLPLVNQLCADPVVLHDLAVFVQPESAAPFRVLARFSFGEGSTKSAQRERF